MLIKFSVSKNEYEGEIVAETGQKRQVVVVCFPSGEGRGIMQFIKSLWYLLKPYWVSEEKYIGLGLLLLNVFCIALEVRTNVGINSFSNDFYSALQNFDKPALIVALKNFAVLLVILIITAGYGVYLNGMLCIRWRRWLTQSYINKWFQHTLMSVDNPDQRISEDIDKFTTESLSAFFIFLQSILAICSFGAVLWNLSGDYFKLPGYLFWCALMYAVIGTGIIHKIGSKLPALNYRQQQYNADFRYLLVKLREEKNCISPKKLEQTFQTIYFNFINVTSLMRKITFFSKGYNTVAFIIGLTIAIPLYLQKQISLGVLMQISGAFSSVIIAFSIFVDKFSFFSEWRAVILRLIECEKEINLVRDKVLITDYTAW